MRLGSAPLSALGGAFLFCSLENTACFPEGRTGRAQPCPWPMAGRSWVGKPGWCGQEGFSPTTRPGWTTTRGTRGACPLIRPDSGCEADNHKQKRRRRRGEPGKARSIPGDGSSSTRSARPRGSPKSLLHELSSPRPSARGLARRRAGRAITERRMASRLVGRSCARPAEAGLTTAPHVPALPDGAFRSGLQGRAAGPAGQSGCATSATDQRQKSPSSWPASGIVTRQGRDKRGRATRTGGRAGGSERDGRAPAAAGSLAPIGSGDGRQRRTELEPGARDQRAEARRHEWKRLSSVRLAQIPKELFQPQYLQK